MSVGISSPVLAPAVMAVYCGATLPAGWHTAWTASPLVWSVMLAWGLATWFLAGRSLQAWSAFAIGIGLYLSPLCALAGTFFGARVVHHVLLACAVAPLLAQAIDGRTRRNFYANLDHSPAAAQRTAGLVAPFVLFAAVFWFWHIPAAYAFGLTDALGYWLMQASILAASIWFWRSVAVGANARVFQVLALVGTAGHMGLLGALIVFAPGLLYPLHAPFVLAWGVDPMADQQFGGLVMWVPAMLPFLAAGLRRIWQGLGPEVPAARLPA